MKIGLVGAGALGTVLAGQLSRAGHGVQIANSRGAHTLRDVEMQTGARAVGIEAVGQDVDLLILAIPLGRTPQLPRALLDTLPATVPVVDTGNYVPSRDGTLTDIEAGMPETVWTSRQTGRPLVKAFNSVSEISLAQRARPAGAKDRVALPVAGDDAGHRATVMRLVETLGFDALDAGPLADSWRQQLGTPAYCTDPDRRQLVRLRARARHDALGRQRAQAMQLMRKLPSDFPKPVLLRVARLMAGLDRAHPASWLALARLAWALRPGRAAAAG